MRFVAYDSENFKVSENATKNFVFFFNRLKVVTPLKTVCIYAGYVLRHGSFVNMKQMSLCVSLFFKTKLSKLNKKGLLLKKKKIIYIPDRRLGAQRLVITKYNIYFFSLHFNVYKIHDLVVVIKRLLIAQSSDGQTFL